MLYRLNITLTEEDYFAFNCFHSYESPKGKKQFQRLRLMFVLLMAFLAALFVYRHGWPRCIPNLISEAVVATIGYFLIFSNKALRRNMRRQIKRLTENGKMPYDSANTFEFYEDKLVEFTNASRTEKTYPAFERICVLSDRYVYLYTNAIGAYILPIEQVKAQTDFQSFLAYLKEICPNVEHY